MTTAVINAPFKADIVGSFLRPTRLKQARANFENQTITSEELTQIENEEIQLLVEKQKKSGLHVITDGEFRRSWWHLDFFWGLNGVERKIIPHGYKFQGRESRPETASLTAKISGENHPFVAHFAYIQQFAENEIIARQTIPSPAQFYFELTRPENKEIVAKIYPDEKELFADIINAYRQVITDLYAQGCRNVQLDDCTWGTLVDPAFASLFKSDSSKCSCGHEHPEQANFSLAFQETLLALNNGVLADQPTDLALTTHVCRGNFASTWAASGGYESVADTLFGKENVTAYYLEFDTERAGGFEPLAKVSGDKQVVLGLVSSKLPELEDSETLIARIHEAAQYVPLDRLSLSTQCGFASTEEGNLLTEEEQWAKIKLVREVADQIWK